MDMIFVQTHATGGDCTAPFDVLHDVDFTLRDLIDNISKRKEWGYVNIRTLSNKTVRIEYRGVPTITNTLSGLLDSNIIKISASGGWGRMDYNVLIED